MLEALHGQAPVRGGLCPSALPGVGERDLPTPETEPWSTLRPADAWRVDRHQHWSRRVSPLVLFGWEVAHHAPIPIQTCAWDLILSRVWAWLRTPRLASQRPELVVLRPWLGPNSYLLLYLPRVSLTGKDGGEGGVIRKGRIQALLDFCPV